VGCSLVLAGVLLPQATVLIARAMTEEKTASREILNFPVRRLGRGAVINTSLGLSC
jgi:hypothetical protein